MGPMFRWKGARLVTASAFAAAGLATWSSSLRPLLLESPSSSSSPSPPPPSSSSALRSVSSPALVSSPAPQHNTKLWDLLVHEWLHWLAAVVGSVADAIIGLYIPKQVKRSTWCCLFLFVFF